MIPRRILNASHWLGAPIGWKPDSDGDCGHLAIRTSGEPRHGSGWCESAWEPTPHELEQLNAGGSIILRIVGWQPPVAIYVERAEYALEPKPSEKILTPNTKAVHEPVVSPAKIQVCPRCEMEAGPLMRFCQNKGCPMRDAP